MRPPTFQVEKSLWKAGFRLVAGVDEAGCGALAGPVVAGACILPFDSRLGDVRDCKLLSPTAREELFPLIQERAIAWGVGSASVEEISTLNIRQAGLLAMRRAVEALAKRPDHLLVDAWTIPGVELPQRGIIKGDRLVKSIAAASILAKVTRDRLMAELAKAYPAYGFEIHKGYGTAFHQTAIKKHGPCPAHRLTYRTFASA